MKTIDQKAKSVSTIIITGIYQHQATSFQIRTKHLKRLKYYIGFATIGIIALIGHTAMISIESREHATANMRLKQEVNRLRTQIPPPVQAEVKKDSNKVETYINGIEERLKRINTYLRKRGVKPFTGGVGGNISKEPTLSAEEKMRLYNTYLSSIMKNIESIPIGYPYFNSQASGYGYRPNPFTSQGSEFHAGVDFRGHTGDIVKSTAKGVVISAGWYQGYGKCVQIAHANHYQTLYGHLSAINVKKGQRIAAGEPIGKIGSTGRSTGPHLHYEVRLNNKPLNPAISF